MSELHWTGELHGHMKGERQVGGVGSHDFIRQFGVSRLRTEEVRLAPQLVRDGFGNQGVDIIGNRGIGFQVFGIYAAAGQQEGMDLVASTRRAGRSRRRLTKAGTSLAGTPVHRWLWRRR